MTYDKQIQQLLVEAGPRGISAQALAKHIYNINNTLFNTSNLDEVYQYVRQYLFRNSKSSQSLVERTERRGFYRLNTEGSDDARQMMLRFTEDAPEPVADDVPPTPDYSLSLFDDF